jgi:putative FmdB family regulatory protein
MKGSIHMPTYEYTCEGCGHHFDEFHSITAEPLKKCPQCGKRKLRRGFGGGAAILFKGSGFYQTDYRSESYQAAAKAEESSSKPAASPQETGKENGSTPAKENGTTSGKKSPKSAS